MAQHVVQAYRQEQQEKLYRVYVTEALWAITNRGSMTKRYIDIIDPQPEETRTAEEIIAKIKKGLGGGG